MLVPEEEQDFFSDGVRESCDVSAPGPTQHILVASTSEVVQQFSRVFSKLKGVVESTSLDQYCCG